MKVFASYQKYIYPEQKRLKGTGCEKRTNNLILGCGVPWLNEKVKGEIHGKETLLLLLLLIDQIP